MYEWGQNRTCCCMIRPGIPTVSASLTLRQTSLSAEVLAKEGTGAPGAIEGGERREELFERWAQQAGIKASKLQHAVFSDPLVGDLR